MSDDTLLIELGTEELPPKTLKRLSQSLTRELLAGLLDAQLINEQQSEAAQPYATPRRLALVVPGVGSAQPEQIIERRGPAIQAAFGDNGKPSPAATGFARSCGVEVEQLDRLKSDKGEWLCFNSKQAGKSITELLPDIIDQSIKRLPIAKRMRWGEGSAEFVRPVQWLIVMHGEQLLPAEVLGIRSGSSTRGHRFHSKGEIEIGHADLYAETLLRSGRVIANFNERQAMILKQINKLAASVNGVIEQDPQLLDEVTGLVELPVAVLGGFEQDFLKVPQECLISSMRDHQKYFHIVDAKGKLLPYFITVSNIESKNPERVIDGNERVLRARLSDAQFFWENDQNTKLEERVEKLDSVLFHVKLGSVLDKTNRVTSLAGTLAAHLKADVDMTRRGALLAKADLISDMVSEFDELQGIMGHYYADLDGEPGVVGECIEQHYWPKFAGDRLPESLEAQSVALADKLDSLVGIYGAGEIPTGDKDPYGLRRAALSILRILIEQQHSIGFDDLVSSAAQVYAEQQDLKISSQQQADIVSFIRGRLTAFYQSQEITTSIINSVMACEPESPLDFENRVKAVAKFSELPEAGDLAAANKRISNIIKKQGTGVGTVIEQGNLDEHAEKKLFDALITIEQQCDLHFDKGDYTQGLQLLAQLRTPVDDFFENVMVMSDDKAKQSNRLALLNKLRLLFLRVADISQLQS